MRVKAKSKDGALKVSVVAGTHVVLMAFDMEDAAAKKLRGFAVSRSGGSGAQGWLCGIKYFPSLLEHTPDTGAEFSSREQPIQSFLWSDYRAEPGVQYEFTVVALCGAVDAMEEAHTVKFKVKTEKENDPKSAHAVWFNRGAVASHELASEFKNKHITKAMVNDVSADGQLGDAEVRWLSRGLAEACLAFINGAKAGEGLRVCAYEFTYQPILWALKRARLRGVDVQIVYHDTKKPKDANVKAITEAKLPKSICHPRTRTSIPHNKFIVKLVKNKPREVWTGSTNFTDTGFYGQTNVGHLVRDAKVAKTYLAYWDLVKQDLTHGEMTPQTMALTANPANAIAHDSIQLVYSPRTTDIMLDWYGLRVRDAGAMALMTLPFNVVPQVMSAMDAKSDSLRLVILENEQTAEINAAEKRNKGRLVFSNGELFGKKLTRNPRGGAKYRPVAHYPVDKWFIEEELARPINSGHVFFVHSKILVIDPLSDDPLICSGSANFSTNSLIANDENMLLIRGEMRVADIYMTEFDRIFRHFYARNATNEIAAHGSSSKNPLHLDESFDWIASNFKVGSYKNYRRLAFFPERKPQNWDVAAKKDKDPFDREDARIEELKAKRRKGAAKKAPAKKKRKVA